MFCKYCGAKLEDNAAFCSNCGCAVDRTDAPKQDFNAEFGAHNNANANNAAFGANYNGGYSQNNGFGYDNGGYTYQSPQQNQYQGVEQKSKLAAGLLALFLGTIGVHNFYLGYTGRAITQLLMSVLSCGILGFVVAVWSFVECIQIFTGGIKTDAKGIPLKD